MGQREGFSSDYHYAALCVYKLLGVFAVGMRVCMCDSESSMLCVHTVTRIDVIFRYPERVPLTHFVHRAKKVFGM
jgi:hypothetical protein